MQITLKSGFGFSQTLALFSPEGSILGVHYSSAHTWAGDGDGTVTVEVSTNEHWVLITHTHIGRVCDIGGWTAEELAAPSPVYGYVICSLEHTRVPEPLTIFADYVSALAAGREILPWMPDGIHSMPSVWGHQAANLWWDVRGGRLIREERWFGTEANPPPFETRESRYVRETRESVIAKRLEEVSRLIGGKDIPGIGRDVRIIKRRGCRTKWGGSTPNLKS